MSKKNAKSQEELLKEALVPSEEQPYDVPRNWVWVKLGGVIDVNPPKLKMTSLTDEDKCSFVPMAAVSDTDGVIFAPEERDFKQVRTGYTQFTDDDVIFAKITPCMENGKSAIAKELINGVGYGSTEFYVLRTSELLENRLLYQLVRSSSFRAEAKQHMTGAVGQQRVPKKFIEDYPFPLPPLNEQKRIADKVERLLDKINQAKQLIEEAKATFELRRAAILDKAFRGELTKKWREENIGTAESLLSKIELLKSKSNAKNKKVNNDIKNVPFELPRGWKWVQLEELIQLSSYGTSSKTNDEVTGVPVLRMGNIFDGQLVLDNLKYLPIDHADVEKFQLEENDLLFNRTNSYELVGKTAVVRGQATRMTYASYLVNVRLYFKDLLADYICYYINGHLGRNALLSMVTQQVGQANINASKLASLLVPLPPEEELVQINQKLNYFFENERTLKSTLEIKEQTDRITEAILSKAFRGELGTNIASEEQVIFNL